MILFLTAGPQAEPVSVADLKAHLRISHDGEDGLLETYVRAARELVEQDAGLCLITQAWRLAADGLPSEGLVPLKRHPVISVDSVTCYGRDGSAVVLDPQSWKLDRKGRPALLDLRKATTATDASNGLEVDFTAGFGSVPDNVPAGLRRAVLLLSAHFWEFRSAYGPGDQPVSWPAEVARLIAPFRRERL
ncbi:MAG: head-tail connector protein [Notoacmeibacter sp.]|nr:head-tail connector protein [Notoacmeibacter sp.]